MLLCRVLYVKTFDFRTFYIIHCFIVKLKLTTSRYLVMSGNDFVVWHIRTRDLSSNLDVFIWKLLSQ